MFKPLSRRSMKRLNCVDLLRYYRRLHSEFDNVGHSDTLAEQAKTLLDVVKLRRTWDHHDTSKREAMSIIGKLVYALDPNQSLILERQRLYVTIQRLQRNHYDPYQRPFDGGSYDDFLAWHQQSLDNYKALQDATARFDDINQMLDNIN